MIKKSNKNILIFKKGKIEKISSKDVSDMKLNDVVCSNNGS